MSLKKDYVETAVSTIKRMEPSLDEDDIRRIVIRILKERITDPSIMMDNNVTGENATITLTGLCNWIDKRNPVISGNATFYMQPTELESPTSNMLRSLKKERKAVKNEMFKYSPDDPIYQMKDLEQQNIKVIMNAEYGGSGTKTAAFYTAYSPAATTLMAQSIITTMAAFFEAYIGDNQLFYNINECYDWMNAVLKKTKKISKWIYRPTTHEVSERIKKHFYMLNLEYVPLLDSFIENLDEDQRTYLFYANNLKGLIRLNPEVRDLVGNILSSLPLYQASENKEVPEEYREVFNSAKEYNDWVSSEMFLDPYHPPKVIVDYMQSLSDLVSQYVYVECLTPDSIVKLNNHRRNTVLLVDTDSNVINSDIFVEFILHEIFPDETFNRPKIYNEMILVNVLASMLSVDVAHILDFYGRCHHMDDTARKELTMKNEFMFRLLFLMRTKKRYAASIVVREGHMMIPFKPELKGLDFIKAGVTDEVSERFTEMLKKYILFSDDIEIHALMRELKKFEKEIREDLINGGTKYLKPQAYKAAEAYKQIKDANGNVVGSKAWSLPVFRGTAVWNILYPLERIYALDRVKIVKLTITKPEDLEPLKSMDPDMYDEIMNKIYNSPDPEIRKAGMKVISIPYTLREMPKWIIPFIDYDLIVSDVISSFRSVLDALNIEEMYQKTPNGKASLTSALISL